METTKKQINKIQEIAFNEFMKIEGVEKCFNNGNGTTIHFYLIEEKDKSEIHQFEFQQLNNNSLKELGFTENAKVKLLFSVNRQTKQLIFN